jgi:hypothetical protein
MRRRLPVCEWRPRLPDWMDPFRAGVMLIGLGLIAYVSPIAAIGAYLVLVVATWND